MLKYFIFSNKKFLLTNCFVIKAEAFNMEEAANKGKVSTQSLPEQSHLLTRPRLFVYTRYENQCSM